jgi:hypothetical protein
MSLLMAVEALLIRRRARLAFCLRLRARGLIGILFLALTLGRHPTLPLFLLLKASHATHSDSRLHHMIRIFLNAILSCFKHPMQLSHDLLHVIHWDVHNELQIACWEQLENQISSQVIHSLATMFVQGLNVTHHLDHMRTGQVALF